MLDRVLNAAVLVADSVELLTVVAHRHVAGRSGLPVRLQEEDVLVQLPVPARRLALELGDSRYRVRIGRRARRDREHHRVRKRIALAVVVGEEKELVLDDRAAQRGPELIEVVRSLRAAVDGVDVVLRVQLLVPIEIETVAVVFIGAGLRHDVDQGAARPPVLRQVAVAVDLELLHGILAELVRRPHAGAARRLAEKRVVVVGAVHDEAVRRPALAGKAQITAAHVAHDAGCGQREVEEAPAVRREVGDEFLAHHRGLLRSGRLDERRLARDRNARLHAGRLEHELDGRIAADGYGHTANLGGREARQLRRDGVVSDRQVEQGELAGRAGGGQPDRGVAGAARALPGNPRSEDQGDCRGLLQARLG